MKTLFKLSVIFAGLALLLAACDIQGGNSPSNIDIKGTYTFSENSYTHTLVFDDDGTYQFTSGSGLSSQNKSGTWSVSGSTLTMSTATPVSISEKFSVSSNGNSYTITLQGGSPVSNILSTFTVVGKTLTITKIGGSTVSSYIVTFDSMGGSDVASQTVNKGAPATKPDDPTANEYMEFVDWHIYRSRLDPPFDFNTPITENIILYAEWNYTLKIGDTGSGGGIICWTSNSSGPNVNEETGKAINFLEIAPDFLGEDLAWSLSNQTFTDTSYSVSGRIEHYGKGFKNTSLILEIDPTAPAAKACREYNGGGKTDWYLPTRLELTAFCYNNEFAYEDPLTEDNPFYHFFITPQNEYIWTSDYSECPWANKSFSGSSSGGYEMSNTYKVVPVRAF